MIDALNAAVGVIGAIASVLTALVGLRQQRNAHGTSGGLARRQDPEPSKAFRRLTRPASLLAFGLLGTVVSGLLIWQVVGTDDQPRAEAILLPHLVGPKERDCQYSTPAEGSLEAIGCSVVDSPVLSVRLSRYPSIKRLRKVISRRVVALGAMPGSCYSQALAVESWDHGSLICNYGDHDFPASLEWSREDSLVLVEAIAAPGAAAPELYDWWRHDDTGSPSNNRLPYPDGYETYVLETANRAAGSCKRVEQYEGSDAAISCKAPTPDYLFLGYYGNITDLRKSIIENLGSGSCRRHVDAPGLSAYYLEGERAGVRACYRNSEEHKVVVEWTNEKTRLFGYAAIYEADEIYNLFGWWERAGKYLTDQR